MVPWVLLPLGLTSSSSLLSYSYAILQPFNYSSGRERASVSRMSIARLESSRIHSPVHDAVGEVEHGDMLAGHFQATRTRAAALEGFSWFYINKRRFLTHGRDSRVTNFLTVNQRANGARAQF